MFSKFQLGTLEQLIRIVAQMGGSAAFGDAVANGDKFQGAVGGVIAIVSFVWWLKRNHTVQLNSLR